MRALRYALDEAMTSIWRGGRSGLLSTVTIALALFVVGGFLLVTSNLERLAGEWSRTAELSVYLQDDVTAADREAIDRTLAADAAVEAREYISKDEALKRFKQTFGELATTIDSVGDNPLPASFEVRLKGGSRSSDAARGLSGSVRRLTGVSDVRYDAQWLDRLLALVRAIRGVGVALGLILAAAAALTVANVVRLALHARKDELEIMQLVGAPGIYIRGPFVVEGIVEGGAGALLALAALLAGYAALRARYLTPLAPTIDLASVRFLPLELCGLVLVGGMLVGCAGGVVAAWSR